MVLEVLETCRRASDLALKATGAVTVAQMYRRNKSSDENVRKESLHYAEELSDTSVKLAGLSMGLLVAECVCAATKTVYTHIQKKKGDKLKEAISAELNKEKEDKE